MGYLYKPQAEVETVKFSHFKFTGKTGSITSEILRHLLGISQLDREMNQSVRNTGCAGHCSGNRTVLTEVAVTLRENGQK